MGLRDDLSAVLLCALAAGCSQSLFDKSPDDPAEADGGGGGGGGDAAPVSECPEPCAGDATFDFDDSQGGSNGRWSYQQDRNAVNGADYEELPFGTWKGLPAWSNGDDGPAIASCVDQDAPVCDGLGGSVLLIPGPVGGTRPALTYKVETTGSYEVTAVVRVSSDAAQDVPVQLIVSRAGRHDAIRAEAIDTSTSEMSFTALVPALAGDEIIVSLASNDASAPPLGIRLYFTSIPEEDVASAFPATCLMALRFDSGDALADACHDITVSDLNDGIGPPGTSMVGLGPNDQMGNGRVLDEGQYLKVGNAPLDYSDDFTISFWAKLAEPQPSFATAPYADWDDVVHGGIAFSLGQDDSSMDFCYQAHPGDIVTCEPTTRPVDGAWHYWRVVRSTTDEKLRFCVDGHLKVELDVNGDLDMTSDQPPHLGRNVDYNPAYFGGTLDEVRVFREALPCVTELP